MRVRCYWLQTSRRRSVFCMSTYEVIRNNRHATHVQIRPEGLLYAAERDLLAIAKFLVTRFVYVFYILDK